MAVSGSCTGLCLNHIFVNDFRCLCRNLKWRSRLELSVEHQSVDCQFRGERPFVQRAGYWGTIVSGLEQFDGADARASAQAREPPAAPARARPFAADPALIRGNSTMRYLLA